MPRRNPKRQFQSQSQSVSIFVVVIFIIFLIGSTVGWAITLGVATLYLVFYLAILFNKEASPPDMSGKKLEQNPHQLRDLQVFRESAQIVARTKNKGTARSRYEVMLELWQQGRVDCDDVSDLLKSAREKTETLEAGLAIEPIKPVKQNEVLSDFFSSQLDYAASAMNDGYWNEARIALRKLGYQHNDASSNQIKKLHELGRRALFEDPIFRSVVNVLPSILSNEPKIKQTSLYEKFPMFSSEELREIFYWAADAGVIQREKKGNTYLISLAPIPNQIND